MIAVVSTSYREADIIELWLAHLLAEGVDLILVADKLADDGTRDLLEQWRKDTGQIEWIEDNHQYHRQAWWTDQLASDAAKRGATWIIPADVDEFPYALSGETIAKTLEDVRSNKIVMQVWPHLDWDHRFVDPHRMNKVAYRYSPDAHVVMGSHDVSLPGGERDILAMRELQYRSFEHFCRKTRDRNFTLENEARQRGDGWHHLRLEGMSTEQMEAEWAQMIAAPTLSDSIPTHLSSVRVKSLIRF